MSTRTQAKTIYEILEEVRKDKGLSQRRACAELETTTTTWRNWGRGQKPGWEWVAPFMVFTGLSYDEVVDAIAEHARQNPEVVRSLNIMRVPLSGRQTVHYETYPTVRAYETTDWDHRPIDVYATNERLRAA